MDSMDVRPSSSSANNNRTTCQRQSAQKIAFKNNEALQYFLRGDFDTAIVLLKEAYSVFASFRHQYYLHLLQFQVQQQHQHYLDCPMDVYCNDNNVGLVRDDDCASLSSSSSSVMRDHDASNSTNRDNSGHHKRQRRVSPQPSNFSQTPSAQSEPSSSSCSSSSSFSCSSASSLYNRAFVLSTDEDDVTMLITNERQTGAILLYNLGLAYNNIGIHLGVSAAIPHAIQLYQWSLSFIDLPSYSILKHSPPPQQEHYCDDRRHRKVNTDHTGRTSSPTMSMDCTGVGSGRSTPPLAAGATAGGNGAVKTNGGGRDLQLSQQVQNRDPFFPLHQEDTKLLLAILNNLSNLFTYLHRIPDAHYALYRLRVVLAASTMMQLTSLSAASSASSHVMNDNSSSSNTRAENSNQGMIFTAKDEDYNWFFINALFKGKELHFAAAA